MVAPIIYPPATTRSNTEQAVGAYRTYRKGAKQRKPYNLPLPYRFEHRVTTGIADGNIQDPRLNWCNQESNAYTPMRGVNVDNSWGDWQIVESRLRNKLMAEVRSSADLGVSLIEGRQALTMVAKRLTQIARFGIRLGKFDFVGAAKALNVEDAAWWKRKRDSGVLRRGSHHFANNYLEYYFGWAPLVGDLMDAFQVLDADIPLGRFSVRSGIPTRTWNYYARGVYYEQGSQHTHNWFGRAGCTVKVVNPNLHLASSLGLLNPWGMAWEVIPFSFVADWFYNVGDYLKSLSDLHGLEFSDVWHSVGNRTNASSFYRTRPTLSGPFYFIVADGLTTRAITVERKLGLPQVYLHRKLVPLFEDKLGRAIAASSLLLQQGLGKSTRR